MVGMLAQDRVYDALLVDHFANNRQMAFVSGPRQVGKTTTCRRHADAYCNWDNLDDRELVLAGPARLAARLGANRLSATSPLFLFDELHKFPRWKPFLKGLYDTYADRLRIIVTGSSRLDVYRRGGDSLMGRYFAYRMHPFSVAETMSRELPDPDRIVRPPRSIDPVEFDALWTYGGYPEPFLKRDARFSRRWRSLRLRQLVREDVRDLTRVQQIDQMEVLVRLLSHGSGRQLVYDTLARETRVAADTIRRWIASERHGARAVRAGVPARQGQAGGGLRGRARPGAVVSRRSETPRNQAESGACALSAAGRRAVRVPRRGGRRPCGRGLLHGAGPAARGPGSDAAVPARVRSSVTARRTAHFVRIVDRLERTHVPGVEV